MIFFNAKNVIWSFCKKLANLSFSIFLLLLISILSILGSLIEQNQTILYYQEYYSINNSNNFLINWKLILAFGLDHLYQTWWFNLILLIFAFSLIICTFSTQLPSLKNARRWKFINFKQSLNFNKALIVSPDILNNSCTNMIYSLNYYNFYVFHKKSYLYAYKGLLGRIAPVFVHFSMITILLGTIFSLFFGLVAQEMIPEGEIFHLKNIVNAGKYSKLPKNFIGRVDNFLIDYNLDNSIKQFFSQISFFDNQGHFLVNKVIYVNSPLIFHGITFYQTDWQIDALRIQLGSQIFIQKKLVKVDINNKIFWLCNLPLSSNKKILLIIFNLKDKVFIYDINGFLVNTLSLNEKFYVNNISIIVKNVMTSTGLQVKIDPGVSIVYIGFFLLILSSTISYISYSQIWVNIRDESFNLTGSTNRAILFFEEDISKISRIYSKYNNYNSL
uniref:Cytochrome c biogenesis protein Ccs1 n=1 Tax=Acrosorium ciliolatum TaxID=1550622 RepID=A0A1Z1M2B3_9FLOR|nr:cytochrome c biogenesis protein ccs1 [Acrosorium ciliolatum]ARW59925.1 cytochrome c biogenesis protein ccs1 [Acrosorium ciliolatum]